MTDRAATVQSFVLTGAPGAGKTPVLRELLAMGSMGVAEAAREVLAEQRAAGGDGVPDKDPQRFCDMMLSRTVDDYRRMAAATVPVFFDRGIPDQIGYAELFRLATSAQRQAATAHRYSDLVFVFPSWPEIYTTDDERKMSFEAADAFGARLREIYESLGYTLVDVPRDDPPSRARFIAEAVTKSDA